MTKQYKLKQGKGVLHIGGGRFFYPSESYKLTDEVLQSHGCYFEALEEEEPKSQEPADMIDEILVSQEAADNEAEEMNLELPEVAVEKDESVPKSRRSNKK